MSNEELVEKTFTQNWEIEDWTNVIQSETSVQNTKTEIECKLEDEVLATFRVGMKVATLVDDYFNYSLQSRYIRLYWELLRKHACLDNLHANVVVEKLNGAGEQNGVFQKEANAVIGQVENIDNNFCQFAYLGDISSYTTLKGSLLVKLHVTLKNLPKLACGIMRESFKRECTDELVKNFSTLLGENCFGDIKIATMDGAELFAHKDILAARCPVFASMFRSDFMEATTGTVNINDISGKTMKILLNYWYTGELLPCWKDTDTILEFTYAAEKYQMTQVLKMLDDFLGYGFTPANLDVELLKMVQKLSLKSAEARLLKRIVQNVSNTKSGKELLLLLSHANDKVTGDDLTAAEILKSFENALSEENRDNTCVHDMILLELSCKLGLKNVENKFVQRIVRTVANCQSSDQLFALIGMGNDTNNDGENEKELLVRAN